MNFEDTNQVPTVRQAMNYFAQKNAKRLVPFRDDPLLTEYFRFVYAIILLGFKEQHSGYEATADMRNKSIYSTELKFLENLSLSKGGKVQKNPDNSFTFSYRPPTDIIAGRIIFKPFSLPYFPEMNCMNFKREELDNMMNNYNKFDKYYSKNIKTSTIYLAQNPDYNNPIHLNVSLSEYIDTVISLLKSIKLVIDPPQIDVPTFLHNQEIIRKNPDILRKSMAKSLIRKGKTTFSMEKIDRFIEFMTNCSYEEYINYNEERDQKHLQDDPTKPKVPRSKYRIFLQPVIKKIDEQIASYEDLQKLAKGKDSLDSKEAYNRQLQYNKSLQENPEKSTSPFEVTPNFNTHTHATAALVNHINQHPELDFRKILDEYRDVICDYYTFFSAIILFDRIFSQSTTSGTLLKQLGVTLSDKNSKLTSKPNGFISHFKYIDTPFGTFEIRINTEYEKKQGDKSHITDNKTVPSINFEESSDPKDVLSQLNYSVPRQTHFTYLDDATLSYSTLSRIDSYLQVAGEFDHRDTTLFEIYQQETDAARTYEQKHFPVKSNSSETGKISYTSILTAIKHTLEKYGITYSDQSISSQQKMMHDFCTLVKETAKDCALPCASNDTLAHETISSDEILAHIKPTGSSSNPKKSKNSGKDYTPFLDF